MKTILIINCGSTSTKCAIYQDLKSIANVSLKHTRDDLVVFSRLIDQYDYRKEMIENWVRKQGFNFVDFDLFVSRGALMKPMESGIYEIKESMLDDLRNETYASHASNLGLLIAFEWSSIFHKKSIFLNPPSTDELSDIARYTGIKGIVRRTAFHALNQKQIALEYAQSIHKNINALKLIVVHLGGGISVGAHLYGRIVDVSNALDGEGPMSAERSGALSARNLIKLYKDLDFDDSKLFKLIAGEGGLVSHTGSSDVKSLLEKAKTDQHLKEIIDAMIYQVAKEIGAMATVLGKGIDAILITGGLAYSDELVNAIKDKVDWIAKIFVYPGEDEMYALASGANRYLSGQETIKNN